jgi:hypothetical protein
VHDEICFVVHATEDANAEGPALAVPAWMTEAASAQCEIVNVARIPAYFPHISGALIRN